MADFGVGEYLAIASIIAAGASTAISSSQQASAAKAQDRIASLNFMAQRQAAEQSIALSRVQYEGNQKLAETQSAAARNNAEALRLEEKAAQAQGSNNADAARREGARLQAATRARYAKSGVLEGGTPLEALAEESGMIQLGLAQDHWQTSERMKLLDFESQLAENQASQVEFEGALQGFRDKSQEVAGQNAVTQAALDRLVGINKAKQMRTAAGASLVAGIGDTAGQAYKFKQTAG